MKVEYTNFEPSRVVGSITIKKGVNTFIFRGEGNSYGLDGQIECFDGSWKELPVDIYFTKLEIDAVASSLDKWIQGVVKHTDGQMFSAEIQQELDEEMKLPEAV